MANTVAQPIPEMTASDLFNKLKEHVLDEGNDAEFYMKMAMCFKKLGMRDTSNMLKIIASQELDHRAMIIESMQRHDYPFTVDEGEEDKTLLVKLKLKKI